MTSWRQRKLEIEQRYPGGVGKNDPLYAAATMTEESARLYEVERELEQARRENDRLRDTIRELEESVRTLTRGDGK